MPYLSVNTMNKNSEYFTSDNYTVNRQNKINKNHVKEDIKNVNYAQIPSNDYPNCKFSQELISIPESTQLIANKSSAFIKNKTPELFLEEKRVEGIIVNFIDKYGEIPENSLKEHLKALKDGDIITLSRQCIHYFILLAAILREHMSDALISSVQASNPTDVYISESWF